MSNEPESKLSERECDRKAYDLWCKAGKAEGEYPKYREAVEKWNQKGAIPTELRRHVDVALSPKLNIWQRLPKSSAWPWITALVIPVLAVGVVFVEIQANRMALREQITESRDALQKSFDAQNEQNRQQILKDYISQMTSLIAEKDLVNNYPKNEKGEYDPEGKPHPDAVAATSLTKTVLKLLEKKSTSDEGNSYNLERGSLVVFLHESKLIQTAKPVINLSGAELSGVELPGANLFKVHLLGADLSGANLTQANLFQSNLLGVRLDRANLERTTLQGANIEGGQLNGANLSVANLTQANLFQANLVGANLVGANLSETNLSGTKLSGVIVNVDKDIFGNDLIADFRRAKGLTDEQKADLKSRGALVDD